MQQHCQTKTFLVYGDSGAGKSSFINSLGALDSDGQQAAEGAGGEAITQQHGKVYQVNHAIMGKIKLIDTRGTWDPQQPDNDSILNDLVKSLLDLSVNLMEDDINTFKIDGIFYIHNSLQYARYPRDQRINHLSSLMGIDLLKSTITIFTHYSNISQMSDLLPKFNELLKYHIDPKTKKMLYPYVFWDSHKEVEAQYNNLYKQIHNPNLQCFTLDSIQNASIKIAELAEQLRQNDKELRDVQKTEIETIYFTRVIERNELKQSDIYITIEIPTSYVKSFLSYFTNQAEQWTSQIHAYQREIQPNMYSDPQMIDPVIKKCQIKSTNLYNAEFIEQPQLMENGDTFTLLLKYKWIGQEDKNKQGRIDIKIETEINYKIEFQDSKQQVKQYIVQELLPRSTDARLYLRQAQQQILDMLTNSVINGMQSQSQKIDESVTIELDQL